MGRTFGIVTESSQSTGIGTSFLIKVDRSGASQDLYFLTANHVVDASCEVNMICSSTTLVKNFWLQQKEIGAWGIKKEGLYAQVEVIFRSTNPDIAILRVSTESSEELKPISLPANCNLKTEESLYSIGFPATYDRTPNAAQTKRWTRGLYTGLLNENREGLRLYIGTTTDSLGGISGGPIISVSGEAVSLVVKSASLPSNQNRYVGVEERDRFDWQTLGVRCEVLQDLNSYFQKK